MKRNKEQQSDIMVLKRKDVFVLKDEPVRNWGDGSVGKVHASKPEDLSPDPQSPVKAENTKGICNPSGGDQSIAGLAS